MKNPISVSRNRILLFTAYNITAFKIIVNIMSNEACFKLARGMPAILLERSSISTISVGLETISGCAVKDNFILNESTPSIFVVLSSLFELVHPFLSFLSESLKKGSLQYVRKKSECYIFI